HRAGARGEIVVGIEPVLRAQGRAPAVERQLRTVRAVDVTPDVEERRLAVDDQPVEIEDDCAKGHGTSVLKRGAGNGKEEGRDRSTRWSRSRAAHPAAASFAVTLRSCWRA